MPKFRKKPVVIEARRITDNTFDDPHPNPTHFKGPVYHPALRQVLIETLEGTMAGNVGDWIIQGIEGELYPCKHEIFEATYEPVEAEGAGEAPIYHAASNETFTAGSEGE